MTKINNRPLGVCTFFTQVVSREVAKPMQDQQMQYEWQIYLCKQHKQLQLGWRRVACKISSRIQCHSEGADLGRGLEGYTGPLWMVWTLGHLKGCRERRWAKSQKTFLETEEVLHEKCNSWNSCKPWSPFLLSWKHFMSMNALTLSYRNLLSFVLSTKRARSEGQTIFNSLPAGLCSCDRSGQLCIVGGSGWFFAQKGL